jgi:hypothetical protein
MIFLKFFEMFLFQFLTIFFCDEFVNNFEIEKSKKIQIPKKKLKTIL